MTYLLIIGIAMIALPVISLWLGLPDHPEDPRQRELQERGQ